jgi:hypothetical protein
VKMPLVPLVNVKRNTSVPSLLKPLTDWSSRRPGAAA